MFPGVDPSTVRQLLLQHTFSPLVSIHSTHSADALFQSECQSASTSVLQVFRPYGNNAKYGIPNQGYKITNTQLVTRTYGSFPVRFEPSLSELLTVHHQADDKLRGLFSLSSLELLMKHRASDQAQAPENLYTSMFRKVITSNRIVSFDTLNHPVAQLFVIDAATDSVESLRSAIVEFRNFNFPRYFQTADLLVHVIVLYDTRTTDENSVAPMLAAIRSTLSVSASTIPMFQACSENVRMSKVENATVEEDVQRISMPEDEYLTLPKTLDSTLRSKLHEFISRTLVPHMERKIRLWDDSVLAPKKSITGRFFSVSRKIFNANESADQHLAGSYNHTGNYYYRSSPEQSIRKLADWSLMLKDFKYAYSTYDLIKKDYTNDKAWLYVAAAQEMCIISLLLAQTQPLASDVMPQVPSRNTLRKIRHDIIEPYIDNLTYTFKSRFNVTTYAIKTYLVVAELLLNMSVMFNLSHWWADLIERYFLTCMAEIDAYLASSDSPHVSRAILYERLGYSTARAVFVPDGYRDAVETMQTVSAGETKKSFSSETEKTETTSVSESTKSDEYINQNKLPCEADTSFKGLTRKRKSALWYILSMREWLLLNNNRQIERLLRSIEEKYDISSNTANWYDREDLILAHIKARSQIPVVSND
ncbi:putative trafficking protein particle complex III-specific subunit [Clavispora lusitaniae]|uniref:Trafficking protein particle complex III-specific subunit n=1 Tax=Clavispora lusitaniae TaxID=36911 RepID=A0AA91PXE1_CLALS|nr:putative trafficking protein particle complex III-specific subunit [Clavispora lusitaniae]